ncbi:glycoside hydrolase [uncultured Algibacter sp.]|uniref:glycoside hydrolase n=1 Tax=uncultured Algibacter sp. TaxID=298659 RepID=UPI002611E800|nr:glycoside hydrolase [uncultured Algibacter sp.]
MKKSFKHRIKRNKLSFFEVAIILSLVSSFSLQSCKSSSNYNKIAIDTNTRYQTMEGFGASDAWRCQYVGSNWPESKKNRIAELLFSKETDENGNPKGIGLSIWRFYIGAGSAEQGQGSNIKNEWRRGESFIDSYGNYDWSKQKGQQWFLQKAKEFGVDKFLAFSISAPVHWTKNGKAYNSDMISGSLNLKADKYNDYAVFMVKVLKYFESEGVAFDFISPINEPQWEWEKKTQEGTPATNADILKLTELLNTEINKSDINTNITIAEAADLRWLYSGYNKEKRGKQIESFFGEEESVKTYENVKNVITGHSYFTTWPVDSLIKIRKKLNKKLESHNIDYWQSEFCVLENTDDIGSGNKRDLSIDTALYVARVMHADITLANASSWQWWTALTNADYKDGLIYLDSGNKGDLFNLDTMKSDGDFHDSKLLWAFGNYSRFISPDMVRVKIDVLNRNKTLEDIYKNDIMFSAYIDKNTSKLVIVGVNYGDEDRIIDFSDVKLDKKYETSKDNSLAFEAVSNNKNIKFKGRSIATLIGDF